MYDDRRIIFTVVGEITYYLSRNCCILQLAIFTREKDIYDHSERKLHYLRFICTLRKFKKGAIIFVFYCGNLIRLGDIDFLSSRL